jgi:hypothetical protein
LADEANIIKLTKPAKMKILNTSCPPRIMPSPRNRMHFSGVMGVSVTDARPLVREKPKSASAVAQPKLKSVSEFESYAEAGKVTT